MKIRYKLVDSRPSPYLPYPLRCQFAVETMRSLSAPAEAQVVELELLLLL